MKKRSAITAAAAASLAFGGAAAAAIQHASATPATATHSENADWEGANSIHVPAMPKVVTVYVDAPASDGTTEARETSVAGRETSESGTGNAGGTTSQAPTGSLTPSATTPTAAHEGPKTGPTSPSGAGDGHNGHADEEDHGVKDTTEPSSTTIPPVTTSTGASSTSCEHPGEDDCAPSHEDDHEDDQESND